MPILNVAVFSVIAIGLMFCGCKSSEPEQLVQPPVVGDAATQVGVSTSSELGKTLNGPGNYMRGMAGNVGKAKNAAALADKTIKERIGMNPGNATGN